MIRVLLVEDDPSAQLLFSSFFEGIEDMELVGGATDGGMGLEMMATHRPHVVLLDLVMPRLSGIGYLQGLSGWENPPVVVVISRVNSQEMIGLALDLGATFYLLKPVNLGELPALIRRLTRRAIKPQGAHGLLQAMGGKDNWAGFRYASRGVALLTEDGERTLKEVYYQVAEERHTSYQCVEKNIRSLVERLWTENTPAWQALWEEPPEKRPTNGMFLRQLGKKLGEG